MAEAKKTLRITQIKSEIGYKYDQGATLKALGLGKINSSVILPDNAATRGQIFKIAHLVSIEEVK